MTGESKGASRHPLAGPFVAVPFVLFEQARKLNLCAEEFTVLCVILAAGQCASADFLPPQELAALCGLDDVVIAETLGKLVSRNVIKIGERRALDGTQSHYFDLSPLWDTCFAPEGKPVNGVSSRDVVSSFEQEFGRPLSSYEYERIVKWLETDKYESWLIEEALKEAVLGSKLNFAYIDKILYEWQRNRIRTKDELEAYRQSYRERTKAKDEAASTRGYRKPRDTGPREKDSRYSAFYELFPDS